MKYYGVLLLALCAHAGYVYEPPAEGMPLFDEGEEQLSLRQQEFQTLAENYAEQMLGTLGAETELAQEQIEDTANPNDRAVNKKKRCGQTKCFCGTPNVNRIVGGMQVRQNKYPWTAQLVKGRYYARLFCGGSLINDRYVLTAAHCVHNNRDQITIRLLQLDRSSRDPGINRKVVQTMVHPAYDPMRIVNDIALLKLESVVPLDKGVRPICLPDAQHNFDGKRAIVAGWGLVKEGGSTSNFLNEVSVPIITNQQCRQTRYKNKITDVMLCAGEVATGGKDACQGDSGGPLIVNEGRYKLAGVVSFGFGCAQANAPGVYARVSKFLKWIRENTKDACYCST